jgi:cysteine desulfurase / selenocysteine lyase
MGQVPDVLFLSEKLLVEASMTGFVDKNAPKIADRDSLRQRMPVSKRFAYFDHAAVGPIPQPTAEAMRKWVDQSLMQGDVCWPEWSAAAAGLRSSASDLLGCKKAEIALIPNTTFGINLVAQGYRWGNSSRAESVVVLENEFSSNLLPWLDLQKRGVEVRRVPVSESGAVSIDAIADAIDGTTRLVAVSWVGYFSGFRLDLARLCELVHRAGSQLFVDAIQGLGVFPLNTGEIPIDYLAADGHKWMLGPEGAGILFVRESNLECLEPMMQGWGSLQMAGQFQTANMLLKNDASRYEGGSANHVGLIGLGESLRMLLSLGCNLPKSPLAHLVLENAASIEDQLQSAGAKVFRARGTSGTDGGLSGILTFDVPGADPNEVRRGLLGEEIVVSVRHGRLRVATHAYNNEQDIDRLVSAVRHIISQQ